jgi:UDP-N-acetylmuramate--alanine ligase
MNPNKNLHFIGIGGSGMSALAQIAAATQTVSGSDRTWPANADLDLFQKLEKNQVRLLPQDGSGITTQTDLVIYSTAIEPNNPDWQKAHELGITTQHRSDFLLSLTQQKELIAVGGTSGKSTITGMIGVLLDRCGLFPTVVNGGEIKNFISPTHLGNAKAGSGPYFVMESDESDGSLTRFFPKSAVISNISKDHKTLAELRALFLQFAAQTQETLILNQDCPEIRQLQWPAKKKMSYALDNNADVKAKEIKLSLSGSSFKVKDVLFELQVPGRHNVSNALAAISVGISIGLPLQQIANALSQFQGIKRRLDFIPSANRHQVIDDFAHNPEKIAASMQTLTPHAKRMIAIFQPHGYGPTRFLFDEYAAVFAAQLRQEDHLFFLPIFDAGGTAQRTISSEDLAAHIRNKNRSAHAVSSKKELLDRLKEMLQAKDTILVMGARDPSLTDLCHQIAKL